MYKIYRLKSGIEFQVGVKTKILMVIAVIGMVLFFKYLDLILEYMIAGF